MASGQPEAPSSGQQRPAAGSGGAAPGGGAAASSSTVACSGARQPAAAARRAVATAPASLHELYGSLAPPGQPFFRFDAKTPQRLVGAAALLVAAYTLFLILWPLRYSLLLTWGVIELIFYVLYWRPRFAELNEQPDKHEPAGLDGLRTFQRFLRFCKDLPHGIDYKAYYSGWFRNTPFEHIKRENAEDFMAYGFWYRSRQQMAAAGLGHVPSQMVDQLEATWGITFQPGFNDRIKFMGHLWEPLNASWRPLVFYLATDLIGWGARQLLKRWGFEHHKHNGLSYFTLNVGRPKAAAPVHSRATSSSTLKDMSAAAAIPGAAAPTLPGAADHCCSGLPPPHRPPANGFAAAAAAAAAAKGGGSGTSSSSSSRSGSPTKPGMQRAGSNGLQRCKSSPFEAGPPDWTPFADPSSTTGSGDQSGAAAAAAAAAAASSAPAAGVFACPAGAKSAPPDAAAVAAAAAAQLRERGSPPGAAAGAAAAAAPQPPAPAPLASGLSSRTSVLLRGAANPLQGALSEGLGSADTPVLFLHGVGGLPAYLEMILHVMGLGHPVIAVEFRGVSMRLGRVMTADEVADTVVGVLDKLGVKEACVVGHSYGTFIAGYLARHHRKRVHTLCLIDPVCFGMFMPHLLYNFLYRTPKLHGWGLHDLVEYGKDVVRLVASRDMHVCATFARRFYWSDLNLWPEDLAPGSVVLLSGKDDLMDAAEVKDMLDVAGHVKVMYNHELTHGAFLLDYEVKQTILAEMRGLLARSGSAVVGLARPVLARTLTLMAHGFGGAPGRVRMKRHGGDTGRYYVEDHSNQLVRTFTGNLTKALAQMQGSFRPGGIDAAPGRERGGGRAAGGAGRAGSAGSAGGVVPGSGEWTASRLMTTFSGPVRRRFGGRSWGGYGADRSSDGGGEAEADAPVAPPPSGEAAAAAAAPGSARGSSGSSGAGAGAAAGAAAPKRAGKLVGHQRAVSRIDEGEAGEECS